MLDVEFLASAQTFSKLLVYQYRSGILRSHMKAAVERFAAQHGRAVLPVEVSELPIVWGSTSLIDGVMFCDVTTDSSSKLRFKGVLHLFEEPPLAPTVIFVDADDTQGMPQTISGIIVEEAIVRPENLLSVLKYLEATSDLVLTGRLFGQSAFESYFRSWLAEKGETSLPEVIQKFDKSVLLFHDPKTGDFVPDDEVDSDQAAPSFLVRALQAFLVSPQPFETADLLRSLARRQQRGLRQRHLVRDICVATVKVINRPGAARELGERKSQSGFARLMPPGDTALLWGVMLLIFASRDEQLPCGRVNAEFLFGFHQLCRNFSRRVTASSTDPMAGLWSELNALMKRSELGSQSAWTNDLLHSMRSMPVTASANDWPRKCQRLFAGPVSLEVGFQMPHVTSEQILDPLCLGDVLGQAKVIGALRSRFVNDRHTTPLVIIGPEGSGKRMLANLYAKALLCEHRGSKEEEACRACSQRNGFDENAGYVTLDLGKQIGVQNVRAILDELRFVPLLSVRRVVVITNTEAAQDAVDVLLKTLEDESYLTTFIVLGCDEKLIRSAALSRSEVWRLKPLCKNEARALARRLLNAQDCLVDILGLIGMYGGRLPGPMMQLCDIIRQTAPATLADAKSRLGIGWGDQVIRYWHSLLVSLEPAADEFTSLAGVEVSEWVRRVRIVLYHLGQTQEVSEAALLGLEQCLDEAKALMHQRAEQCGISPEMLWNDLARHWQLDGIIDAQSFFYAGVRSRKIATIKRSPANMGL